MPGRLIICATPIGNLADAAPRLATALAGADLIYAEDTRRTATLLRHFGITVPLRSYFAGNEAQLSAELGSKLEADRTIALVTDAGTPVIADPGASAVRVATSVGASVTVVPGPSAVTAALAVSGMSGDRFVFEGFLPKKGGARAERLDVLAAEERTIVLFSPPRRIAVDLEALADALGPDRSVTVCRELTKLHEEIEHSTLGESARRWAAGQVRGEFTVVVAGAPHHVGDIAQALRDVQTSMDGGASLSDAVRSVAAARNVSRRRLYQAALQGSVADPE